MATDTQQKPSDALVNPSVENPNKAIDPPHSETPTTAVESPKETSDSKTTVPAVATASSVAPAAVSDIEKKMRRAERFGISVQLTEKEKRDSRAERFGTYSGTVSSSVSGSEPSKKSEELKRKARAERFGIPTPPVASEEEVKKKARLARFAPAAKMDPLEDDKRKARALRFASTPSKSLSQENGKGNIEPQNAAIAGKAGGGA